MQRAIETERLKKSVAMIGGLPQIKDPELADREWAANTDQTRRAIASPAGPEENDEQSREDTFAFWKAKKMRLDYERAAGDLVSATDMRATMADDYSVVRTKLLGIPSKAKQRLPHLKLEDLATLEEIVRESLEELAGDGITKDPIQEHQ